MTIPRAKARCTKDRKSRVSAKTAMPVQQAAAIK